MGVGSVAGTVHQPRGGLFMRYWHKTVVLLILVVFPVACSLGETEAHDPKEVLADFSLAVENSPDLDKTDAVEVKGKYLAYWSISALTLGSTKRVVGETYRVTFHFDPYDPDTKETWEFDMESAHFRAGRPRGPKFSDTLFLSIYPSLCHILGNVGPRW